MEERPIINLSLENTGKQRRLTGDKGGDKEATEQRLRQRGSVRGEKEANDTPEMR